MLKIRLFFGNKKNNRFSLILFVFFVKRIESCLIKILTKLTYMLYAINAENCAQSLPCKGMYNFSFWVNISLIFFIIF